MRCAYCGSHAKDDEYGNCSACGAPRQEVKQLVFQPSDIEYTLTGVMPPDILVPLKKVILQDFDNFMKAYKG